jgi:hypothetical protein
VQKPTLDKHCTFHNSYTATLYLERRGHVGCHCDVTCVHLSFFHPRHQNTCRQQLIALDTGSAGSLQNATRHHGCTSAHLLAQVCHGRLEARERQGGVLTQTHTLRKQRRQTNMGLQRHGRAAGASAVQKYVHKGKPAARDVSDTPPCPCPWTWGQGGGTPCHCPALRVPPPGHPHDRLAHVPHHRTTDTPRTGWRTAVE